MEQHIDKMYKLTIIKRATLPTSEDIQKFEIANRLSLPEIFKDFLLKINPISILENTYRCKARTYWLSDFYPFGNDEMGLQASFERLNEFFEDKYIAFADDSGGWQFVISLQEEDYGKVYFCRMDEELEDALTLLADSFEEFIDGLQESSEE